MAINEQQVYKIHLQREMCMYSIDIPSYKCTIICIYRIPKRNPYHFLRKLEQLMQILRKKKNRKIIITGDFNIDLLKSSEVLNEYNRIIENHNFIIHINEPTRSKACLDQIISNCKDATGKVLPLGLSDHETAQLFSTSLTCKNIAQKKYFTQKETSVLKT